MVGYTSNINILLPDLYLFMNQPNSYILSLALCKKNLFKKKLKEGFPGAWASLVAQRLKRLPPMWKTWVPSLGREDPLEKEMATHCSILAWRIPRTE